MAANEFECGKFGFEKRKYAENVRRRMAARKKQQGGRIMRVYQCTRCKKWHIGSSFG